MVEILMKPKYKSYATTEDFAELASINPSTLKKYIWLLLSIQDHLKLHPMHRLRNIEQST